MLAVVVVVVDCESGGVHASAGESNLCHCWKTGVASASLLVKGHRATV